MAACPNLDGMTPWQIFAAGIRAAEQHHKIVSKP
jgi:hypothetical protein